MWTLIKSNVNFHKLNTFVLTADWPDQYIDLFWVPQKLPYTPFQSRLTVGAPPGPHTAFLGTNVWCSAHRMRCPEGHSRMQNLVMWPFCFEHPMAPTYLYKSIQTPPSGISCLERSSPTGLPTFFFPLSTPKHPTQNPALDFWLVCFLNCGYPNCNAPVSL